MLPSSSTMTPAATTRTRPLTHYTVALLDEIAS
jgi:hypothetical protein